MLFVTDQANAPACSSAGASQSLQGYGHRL